jgi:DNA-binding beta-propeller fold protein YncE
MKVLDSLHPSTSEHPDAEALIEEARQRQRKRRLYVASAVLIVAVASGVWVSSNGGSAVKLPSTSRKPTHVTSPAPTPSRRTPTTPVYFTGVRYGGPTFLASVNPVTGRLGKTIVVGGTIGLVPGGHEALALSCPSIDRVCPVDLANGHVGEPIRVGLAPVAVAFSPSGRTAYVADAGEAAYFPPFPSGGPDRPSNSVTPIDLQNDRPGRAIKVCQGPTALAVSASAHMLVVACRTQVALVDTLTQRTIRVLDVGGFHRGIVAISPSGDEALVGDTGFGDSPISSGDIVPIDLRTAAAGIPISIGGSSGVGGSMDLAFAPGVDRYVYVTTERIERKPPWSTYQVVIRVDLVTRHVSAPLKLGGETVSDVYFWPNGETGYIAPVPSHGVPDLYRVALSQHVTGHVVHLDGRPSFDAQAPYFSVIPLNNGRRQLTVVDMATGVEHVVKLKFFPDEVVLPR